MKRVYFIYFEWKYEWYYQNYWIIRRFRHINWWSYWNSKNKIKEQEGEFIGTFLALLGALLLQSLIFSVVKGISGKEVRTAGGGYMYEIF